MNHVLENTLAYSPAVRLVHLVIANCVNDMYEEEFWASVATIQRQTGLARSTVQNAIGLLVEFGHLEMLSEKPGKPTRYRFIYTPSLKVAEDRAARESGTHLPDQEAEPARESGTNSSIGKENSTGGGKSISQELWDVLCLACKINQTEITKSLRGELNKAISELKKVEAKPRDVLRRSVVYRQKFPGAALTPSALAKHWATLGPVDRSVVEIYPGAAQQVPVAAQEQSPEEKERAQARIRELSERFHAGT